MSALTGGDEREWPHDPDGDEGSEGGRKYGMAILAKKLDEEADFPLAAETFLAGHGDEPVRLDYRTVVAVADVFEHVEGTEFETMTEFHRAVGEAMRRGGLREYRPGDGAEA